MASAPFATVRTTAARGLVSLYGDQVDVFDNSALQGEPGALVTGNGLELCLRGSAQYAEVTVTCTTDGTGTGEPTGTRTLDLPTGSIVVANGDAAAFGPFPVPAGGGLYRVDVYNVDCRDDYLAVFTRLGDSPDKDEDD
ncbi:hypothetical protein [Kutzneria chonburiensis]|uniref:Uncharacterized protein n=1 Tax=Kutzneria chonburiensis TaxID=1483604 RepID=A0ABV6N5M5_9PSEU|nr:hypothetical protein [Kutzneria chonburiensis]